MLERLRPRGSCRQIIKHDVAPLNVPILAVVLPCDGILLPPGSRLRLREFRVAA